MLLSKADRAESIKMRFGLLTLALVGVLAGCSDRSYRPQAVETEAVRSGDKAGQIAYARRVRDYLRAMDDASDQFAGIRDYDWEQWAPPSSEWLLDMLPSVSTCENLADAIRGLPTEDQIYLANLESTIAVWANYATFSHEKLTADQAWYLIEVHSKYGKRPIPVDTLEKELGDLMDEDRRFFLARIVALEDTADLGDARLVAFYEQVVLPAHGWQYFRTKRDFPPEYLLRLNAPGL